jgi:F-type H+-transporting ATPase subunit epsilon
MANLPTSLTLEVATPLGTALAVRTDSVQMPSVEGEVGVLPGHVPLLAALKPGILTYRQEGQLLRAAIGGGYAEATPDHVRVITEYFVKPEQVDAQAAQRDLHAAEARLKETKATIVEVEYQEAQRDYEWAQARLNLIGASSN